MSWFAKFLSPKTTINVIRVAEVRSLKCQRDTNLALFPARAYIYNLVSSYTEGVWPISSCYVVTFNQ